MPKGAARISDLEGNEFTELVNLDHLKKYYLLKKREIKENKNKEIKVC